MATSSTDCQTSCGTQPRASVPLGEVPVQTLLEIVRQHGTPTFAYDLSRIRAQIAKLRTHLPAEVEMIYSLKANASLGLSGFIGRCGLGADVASAGELATAVSAGFPPERILVSGPDKSPAMLAQLRSVPGTYVSVDSLSELQLLAELDQPQRVLLRLRPDFASVAACAAGSDSRFGLVADDLPACHPYLHTRGVRVVGFHVFAGSQVLNVAGINHHLRSALEQSLRAAEVLDLSPELIDLGGGFGVPYGPEDTELDLLAVGEELRALVKRAAPARLLLELGRYIVAPAGWYLTTVIARQTHQGRPAVVVDGGHHQRGDLCGLGLRRRAFAPVALSATASQNVSLPTDVLGCLSLPGDVLTEAGLLPTLSPGDVLAFPNAGAYGLTASPILFHGHPAPAEVAFDEAGMELIRRRPAVTSLLEGQNLLQELHASRSIKT